MVERVDRYVCARVCACGVCICVVGPPGGVQAFVGGWSETQKVRIRGVCVWMCGCVCVVGLPGCVQPFVGGWSEAQEVRVRSSHRVEHVPHKRAAL